MKWKNRISWLGTILFTILGVIYILPIFVVLINSFKEKTFINLEPFKLPTKETWNIISAADSKMHVFF